MSGSSQFRRVGLLLSCAVLAASILVAGGSGPASASATNDPIRMQSENDRTPSDCTASSGWACGGWDQLPGGGIAARPYVKKFSVVNGSTVTDIIDNAGTDPNPSTKPGVQSNLSVVIAPTNLCGPGQSPTRNGNPFCYTTPNRVGVTVAYTGSDRQGHYDLRTPGATTPSVTANTEFRLTLALNTVGQNLRWSYLDGTPSYWKITNIGSPNATLEIRFRAGDTPFVSGGGGCSQIPVNPTCDYPTASEMLLSASLMLSLDTTLDPVFTGALFSGNGAYVGSLETTSPGQTETSPTAVPQMTYGLAAPATTGSTPNRPDFSAFLSEEAILNYFGMPLDSFLPDGSNASTTSTFFDEAFAFQKVLANGTTTSPGTRTVSRWTSSSNGTEGIFFTIADMTISTASTPSDLGPAAVTRATNPKFRVKQATTAPTITATRTKVSIAGTMPTVCTATGATCRIRVLRLDGARSKTFTTLLTSGPQTLRNSTTTQINLTTSLTAASTRVAIIIESRPNASAAWKYATSVVRRIP